MAYNEAANILDQLLQRKNGLKSLVYGGKELKGKRSNTRRAYALVCETLKYKAVIDDVLDLTTFRADNPKIAWPLYYVALYDFLFGKGVQCGGKVKGTIHQHKNQLRSALVRIKVKRMAQSNKDLLPDALRCMTALPRYARVNTTKISLGKTLQLVQKGDETDRPSSSSGDMVVSVPPAVDTHIPNLLKWPPNTDLHAHPLVSSGSLILQDKSSCFPGSILVGEGLANDASLVQWDIIDACAAPGNKTSHAACLLMAHAARKHQKRIAVDGAATTSSSGGEGEGDELDDGVSEPVQKKLMQELQAGTVFAFDKSEKRLGVLSSRMDRMGVHNVTPICTDFLETDPQDPRYARVRSILLDPSCSGSGMVGYRLDHMLTNMSMHGDTGGRGGGGGKKKGKGKGQGQGRGKGRGGGDRAGARAAEDEEVEVDGAFSSGAEEEAERLEALAQFQLAALLKAFSFPQVERVTYSTCSVHEIENERVVAQALEQQHRQQQEHDKQLQQQQQQQSTTTTSGGGGSSRAVPASNSRPFVLRPCLPTWPRRGLQVDGLSAEQARCVVRVNDHLGSGGSQREGNRTAGGAKKTKKKTKKKKKKKKKGGVEIAAAVAKAEGEEGEEEGEEGEGEEEEGGGMAALAMPAPTATAIASASADELRAMFGAGAGTASGGSANSRSGPSRPGSESAARGAPSYEARQQRQREELKRKRALKRQRQKEEREDAEVSFEEGAEGGEGGAQKRKARHAPVENAKLRRKKIREGKFKGREY